MGGLDLPPKGSPDLHLVVATETERWAQWNANSVEWRGALGHDAYLRREAHLWSQKLTKNGGNTPWVLVYQPDANGPRQVLCGCETIRKRALVARHSQVKEVISPCVGSVFCPPDFRGRGYAGRMMSELGKKLESWQTENGMPCLFSVLYSDIGKEFYATRGWKPFASAHLTLSPSALLPAVPVRLLTSEDIAELCALDEKLIRKQLARAGSTGKVAVVTLPDHQTIEWHHAREDFVANELYMKSPHVKGAIVGDTPGSRVWAYFKRVWMDPEGDSPSTLHILRLVVEDDTMSGSMPALAESAEQVKNSYVVRAIAAILQQAQFEASQWDMHEVSVWNPSSATLAAVQSIDPDAAVVHRETESITSLLWYGAEREEDIDWICNEKYGWN